MVSALEGSTVVDYIVVTKRSTCLLYNGSLGHMPVWIGTLVILSIATFSLVLLLCYAWNMGVNKFFGSDYVHTTATPLNCAMEFAIACENMKLHAYNNFLNHGHPHISLLSGNDNYLQDLSLSYYKHF